MFLMGKPNVIETVIVDDPETKTALAEWISDRGKDRRDTITPNRIPIPESSDKRNATRSRPKTSR